MKKANILLITFFALTANAQAKEELITLSSRAGVEQNFLLIEDPEAAASVILFAGGKGALMLSKGLFGVGIGWGKNNFLVRTRKDFANHGFNVAVVDAPSDQQGKTGMYGGFRTSADHVTDIDAVMAELRRRANVPVWLIGTSRGTESAAYVAIHAKQRPDGLVLTSSMSVPNSKGTAVTEMPLDKITIPALIVAHKQDDCNGTPPEGAEEIKAGLSNASKVTVIYFDGGREESNPCRAKSYHGFLDIENKVVDSIAAFIKGQ